MNPGDIVLISLPQAAGGPPKLRPALILAALPGPYQTHHLCGVSTQLAKIVPNWDEILQPGDPDFPPSGLHRASAIRLSYLHATDPTAIAGVLGQIDPARLERLLQRLADHLHP